MRSARVKRSHGLMSNPSASRPSKRSPTVPDMDRAAVTTILIDDDAVPLIKRGNSWRMFLLESWASGCFDDNMLRTLAYKSSENGASNLKHVFVFLVVCLFLFF